MLHKKSGTTFLVAIFLDQAIDQDESTRSIRVAIDLDIVLVVGVLLNDLV
ncbi:MAG: hypothetical protein VYB72_10190 [Planctomycetota bacterium]|nr:hypothetical protein [Planctomycetota bacterium]